MASLLNDVIEDYRKRALLAAFSFKDLVYRLFAFLLTASFILWLSVFIYVSFYYAYVPAISHIRPVHLEFNGCAEGAGACSNPSANITLTHQRQLLQSNQPYKIILDLELPESEANKHLGMFMVQVVLTGRDGKFIAQSRRIAMLRYKSWVLHLLSTLICSPALMVGPMEEKQMLQVEMFSEFLESVNNPVTDIRVEVESRKVQLYSAKLRIQAEFTGLRYFMFYWPALSAAIGIATHVVLLSFLFGYVWYRLLNPNQVVVRVGLGLNRSATSSQALTSSSPVVGTAGPMVAHVEPQPPEGQTTKTLEQRRMEARETLMRERQRQMLNSPVSRPLPARIRSQSFSTAPIVDRLSSAGLNSSPVRIQELAAPILSEPTKEEKGEKAEDLADADEGGLTLLADGRPPTTSESELRHRSTSTSAGSNKEADASF